MSKRGESNSYLGNVHLNLFLVRASKIGSGLSGRNSGGKIGAAAASLKEIFVCKQSVNMTNTNENAALQTLIQLEIQIHLHVSLIFTSALFNANIKKRKKSGLLPNPPRIPHNNFGCVFWPF